MPYTIFIDPAVNCVFTKLAGDFDLDNREQSLEMVLNHPDFKIGMNMLRDARDLTYPEEATFKYISEIAEEKLRKYDESFGNCRWATVVADARSYAILHQFVITGRFNKSKVERKPFRDIEAAKEWLGIPENYEIKFRSTKETT
jgi:hypothetical protein|tara:strand:+ start:3566 stop:3997 length:432 start_codon:yes stop_codon:yes gene_type:complete